MVQGSAPQSLLVFDHVTRRIALLHDGPEEERQALRDKVISQLRGPVPGNGQTVETSPAEPSLSEEEFCERVEACKEYIAAGDIYQIVISVLFKGRAVVTPADFFKCHGIATGVV